MKNNFQSKSVPRGTRTIWRYLGALFLLFTFAIDNVWAADETTTFNFAEGSTTGLTIAKSGTIANISYLVTNSTYNQIPTLSDGNYFLGMKFTSNSQGVLDVTTTNSFTNIKSISFDCAADNNSNPKIEVYIVDDKNAETKVLNAIAMSSGSTKVWRSKKSGVGVYTIDLSSSPKTGKVHFKFITGSSGKSGAIDDIVITTGSGEVTPVCPSGMTISGTQSYLVGQKLTLTAALSAGNGDITYQWYKGSVAAGKAISGATSTTYEVNSCALDDGGDYFCVASKTSCEDAVNASAYTVTVTEPKTIDDLVTITEDRTFTPNATIAVGMTADGDRFLAAGANECDYSGGMRVKENRALAFKVNSGAKVKVTFTEKSDDSVPREMQLGTAASDDDNKAYGHSGTSPAEFTVTTGGVVYLTASSDLRFSKLEITYPVPACAATVPGDISKGDLTAGEITLTAAGSAEEGDTWYWQSSATGEDKTGTSGAAKTVNAAGTYYIRSYNTAGDCWSAAKSIELTAEDFLATPEVTFTNGAYVVGASALNLGTLFTSENTSAVTFALKVASDDATVSGNNFTATKEGSYVIVATQAADANYKAVSKEATITVTYPATGSATVTYKIAVGTSQTTLGTASKEDNSASISGLSDFAFAGGLDVLSGGGKDASSPKIANPTAKDENKYLYFTFNVADGYEFVISSVSTKVVAVSNVKTIEVALSDTEGTSESLSYDQAKNNDPTEHVFDFAGKAYSGTVTLKIYAYAATEEGYRLGQPLTISGTVQAATPKFAVSFAKGGADGSETMSPVSYEVGAQVTAPDCDFTYTDHIFSEWAVTGVGGVSTIAAGSSFTMPAGPVTLTAQWLANNYEAKIGTTFYATFADALAHAADGEIVLLKDVNVTAQIDIAAGVTATIDLAGKKIEYTGTADLSSGVIMVHNGASLTINDSSDPDAGKVVSGEKAYAAIALTKAGDDAANPAVLVINGGIFTGYYYAITGNGARHNTNITINGGTFTATAENDNLAIYHPQNGTLTINGGSFEGYLSAIEMRAGSLVINDGSFTATAPTFSCNAAGSGTTTQGAAIAIAQHTTKKDISVTINGGTFTGVKALNESNPQENDPAPQVTMAVTGGNFTGEVSTVDVNKFISGGTYNHVVPAGQCAEGYIPSAEIAPGKYGVIATAKSVDFTDSDVQALGVGTAMSTYNYTLATTTNVSFDNTNAYDTGLKMKQSTTNTLSFVVEPGKLVTIVTGNIAGMTYSVNGGAATALNGGSDKDHLGYTYLYNDAVQNIVLAETSTTYNIIREINIHDPYEVSYDVDGGDPVAAQYGYPSVTLPLPIKGTESFIGWFDGETKVGEAGEQYTPTANITLKAHWEAVSTDARLASITFSAAGTLSPAFDPEITNYTYTMPYGTAAVPTITGATSVSAKAQEPQIVSQASAWGETAVIRGVAESSDTKAYNITMKLAPKDGICLIWGNVADNSLTRDADKSKYNGTLVNDNVRANAATYEEKTGPKFQKPGYLSLALDGQTFKAGDVVEAFITQINGADKLRIFNANEALDANVIAEGTIALGVSRVALPVDAETIYLRRGDNEAGESYKDWNPCVAYVAVYRISNPILKSLTVAGVDGAPVGNVVEIEVPASTPDDALDAITYDWISNNDAWTAAHTPAATNAWEWGVENTVTFTDKDGDESVYYVTINKAAVSTDATLSALGYGDPATAIALSEGVFEYDVELPYGTSAVPAITLATPHHTGASVTDITDATTFVDRKATSTVTVKAEDNATTQLYKVNFIVSRFESKLLWDGSTMSALSDITAAAAAADVSITTTGVSVTSFSAIPCEENGKSYTRALDFGGNTKSSRYFGIEIPDGKVAKVSVVYKAKGTGARSIIIGTALTGVVDESAITSVACSGDASKLHIMTADMFGGGTLYINTTDGFHVHEISLQLADGHARSAMLGNGVLGTVCVPNNVAVEDIQGVTVYELMGRENTYGKLAFDEIISGELEAGAPYVFQAHRNHMALLYGEKHKNNPVDKGNGMYGTFETIVLTDLTDVYYFAQRALWSCDGAVDLTVAANRAYVKLSEIDYLTDPNPAPGRRRILLGVNGENQAQGFENLESGDKPLKVMIDGTLYIIRGEKVFDATGRLVK